MTDQQRIDLSRREVTSIASVGIWFELILMQMLVRHVYDHDPTTEHVQYALTEIGDECRHSVMFARMIDKLGCPAYGAGRWGHAQGRLFKTISNGPLTFAGALYVEAILDAFQREAMNDESIQPLVRDVSRIHVTEEARHMRYAGEELARAWARLSRAERAYSRALLGIVAYVATTRLIHPRVYAAVGLDVDEARQASAPTPTGSRPVVGLPGRSSPSSRSSSSCVAPAASTGVGRASSPREDIVSDRELGTLLRTCRWSPTLGNDPPVTNAPVGRFGLPGSVVLVGAVR